MKKLISLKTFQSQRVGERIVRNVTPAEVFEYYRAKCNFSLRQLEKLTGIRHSNLSAIEKGRRPLGPKTAKALGYAFGCDYRDFL